MTTKTIDLGMKIFNLSVLEKEPLDDLYPIKLKMPIGRLSPTTSIMEITNNLKSLG